MYFGAKKMLQVKNEIIINLISKLGCYKNLH